MPRMWVCERKHQWPQAPETDLGAAAPLCPECGSLGIEMRTESPEEGHVESTVWSPMGFQGWSPGGGERLPPPALADFEIQGEVGRGGMGVVYKARQLSTNRIVAVKVIRKDRLLHEEAVERFRRETRVASRLDHPNIVGVLDSDHTGDTHYLVMEYVAGVTLEHLVEQRGPLAIEQACEYVRQAALGLQHALEQGLVHRDIKPSNLMVTPAPGTSEPAGLIKILDMGVARMLQVVGGPPGESFSTLTQRGAVLGTPDFVAPEQLENPHNADIRADLYSLGCTFYFLLTSQVPFPGGTLLSKLDKQRWETPRPVQQLRPEVSAGLDGVLQKLLAKDPADRYAQPLELARAIEVLAARGYMGQAGGQLRSVQRLAGHEGPVWAATFSPDGRWILSGGKDRRARLWEAATGKLVRAFSPLPQEIRCVAFAPEGDRLIVGSGVSLRLLAMESGQELKRFSGHSDVVRTAAFSVNGKWLITGGDDKSLRVWDVASGRERQRLARHTGAITGLAVAAAGEGVLTASRDQTLRRWNLTPGQETSCLVTGAGAVLAVALAPGDRLAVSAHFDTLLRIWDLNGGIEVRRLPGHKQMVSAVAFTPDGRHIVSGAQDQTVRLWDVESGREVASGAEHRGGVHAVSCRGKLALSAGGDGLVHVWELPR